MLDPMAAYVIKFFENIPPPDPRVSVKEYREKVNNIFREAASTLKEEVANVEDKTIKTKDSEIKIRIYQQRPWSPVMIYFHGGGFVFGDLETYDPICKRIARISNATVVSVDYRLAPEYKFPCAVKDAYNALKFVVENADDIRVDADKIVVAGDSAGGNLAAVVSILCRDNGERWIKKQVLIYPVVNFLAPTPSLIYFRDGYGLLSSQLMEWFTKQYLRNDNDRSNPLASPIIAKLNDLPPALIITAEYDPLRDEGEMYGILMRKYGSEASIVRYNGLVHGFINFYPILRAGKEAISQVAASLFDL